MNYRKCLIIIAACAVGFWLFFLWFFSPSPKYNPANVEPRLAALREPFRTVDTGYITDGGSIRITIEDADGKQESFCVLARMNEPARYKRVTVGGYVGPTGTGTLVSHPEDTKWRLVEILASPKYSSPWNDFGLSVLRGRPADHFRSILNRWTGKMRPGGP